MEIELTENLRRRRDELRGKLDDLEGDAGSGVLQAGEVDSRNGELRNLIRSIEQLGEQVQGIYLASCSPSRYFLTDLPQNLRRSWKNSTPKY